MFNSTENIDKTPENLDNYFVRPHNRLFKGAEDAQAGMREYAGQVEAVKVYDGLTVPQLKGIVAEAAKANIPVIGHFKNVRIAAEVDANGIEHMAAVANAILDERAQAEALKRVRKGFRPPSESFMDVKQIPAIVDLMVKEGLYLNPTLRMAWQGDRALREKGFHYEDFDLTFNDWRLRYIPLGFRLANLKEFQEIGLWNWRDLTEYEQDVFHQGYVNSLRVVKAFADAGGSCTPEPTPRTWPCPGSRCIRSWS